MGPSRGVLSLIMATRLLSSLTRLLPSLRLRLVAPAVAGLLVAGVPTRGPVARPPMTSEAAALLADGSRWADSLVAATRGAGARRLPDSLVITLGYLERQRQGLGSPFRLIDLALTDPRLPAAMRQRLGWAMLERTRRGEQGVVHPGALLDTRVRRAPDPAREAAIAAAHLALIERAVGFAPDPRTGELSVRLAYTLGAAEGHVPAAALSRVLRAAAVARDRVIAQQDVGRLLRHARRTGVDPLALVGSWRRERWFAVERPPAADGLAPDRAVVERRAMSRVAPLLAELREIAAGRVGLSPPSPGEPLLGAGAARRLVVLAATAAPPATPVVVAVRSERDSLMRAGGAATEVARRARNEEGLAASLAWLEAAGDDALPAYAARVALDAAVGLRALAQEAPWHADPAADVDANATARALGIAQISFDRRVPRAWRPYYLRTLAVAVTDLRRVLPEASFDGLKVRFTTGGPANALALHEPRTRTITLPIETSSGTIAHELAHDLDWQAARALYKRRGTYSTDVAVSRDAALATSLRGMTAARLIAPDSANGWQAPHQQRPAEVFARNVDWFVAAALAREGRSNGHLSAVQDEALTGYASVLPREVGGRGTAALMDAMALVAPVADVTRDWFLEHWGAARALRPAAIVRHAVGLSLRRPPLPSVRPSSPARAIETAVQAAVASCTARPVAAGASGASPASLALLAVDSRARGLVRSRAEWYRAERRPPWAQAVLGVGPWDPVLAEQALGRVRAQLVTQLGGRGDLADPFDVAGLAGLGRGCL